MICLRTEHGSVSQMWRFSISGDKLALYELLDAWLCLEMFAEFLDRYRMGHCNGSGRVVYTLFCKWEMHRTWSLAVGPS